MDGSLCEEKDFAIHSLPCSSSVPPPSKGRVLGSQESRRRERGGSPLVHMDGLGSHCSQSKGQVFSFLSAALSFFSSTVETLGLCKAIKAYSTPPIQFFWVFLFVCLLFCLLFPNKCFLLRRARDISPSVAHASSAPHLEPNAAASPNQNFLYPKLVFISNDNFSLTSSRKPSIITAAHPDLPPPLFSYS